MFHIISIAVAAVTVALFVSPVVIAALDKFEQVSAALTL